MEITNIYPVKGEVRACKGISKKTQKEYNLVILHIDTELYGPVDVVLNDKTDRAGVILSLLVKE